MLKSAVITVSRTHSQEDINNKLSELNISADAFIQAVVIREETTNSQAKIVIFYEEEI